MNIAKYLLITAFVLFSLPALAQEELVPAQGWYFRIDAGYSIARDPELTILESVPADLGGSSVIGAGIGLTYVPGIRTDLTLTYRSGFQQISGVPEVASGEAEMDSLATLLSLYLDFYSTPRMSPYAGFGLGFARNKLGEIVITNPDGSLLGTIEGKSKTNFAWQLCIGATIQVTNRLLLDVGYHYLKAGDYESDNLLVFSDGTGIFSKNRGKVRANDFLVSLQYIF